MRSRTKTTALVATGAVALSSAAYGIGTQAGDGSASAGDSGAQGPPRGGPPDGAPDGWHRSGAPPGFDNLADALGVDAEELRDALMDFHRENRGEHRSAFATALAEALGVSVDKVESAFEELGQKRHSGFAAELADRLGVEAARVEAALDKLMAEKPVGFSELAEALADELGLEASKVEAALAELRPEGRARPHRRPPFPVRQLAAALDVTQAELRQALREVRAGAESDREGHRSELVKFLAERFDVSEDKVDEALGDLPGPGPGFHGGPPPGPGGPGPGLGSAPPGAEGSGPGLGVSS
jgi:hypothetical protein